MRLKDLLNHQNIIIQSHDNPDADSLASGYALYCYFQSMGKNVRLIYSGRYRIQKSNLLLMVEKLSIPIEYVKMPLQAELLITVDCQYGTGNVTKHEAQEVAIIDHHQLEIDANAYEHMEVRSYLGCCSTLVWQLLQNEGFDVNQDVKIATALFYGLYTDTGQLAEIFHPLDRDMRDALHYEQATILNLRNSNISRDELEIAGLALLRYIYNERYRFAVIKVKPCDPNILGLISDFLLQVDSIDTCVVFNEVQDGIKISVRSCIKEVKACELAGYLTDVIGSGGGHNEKAGGFIQRQLFEEQYENMNLEAYFTERMNHYFNSFEVIDASQYTIDLSQAKQYRKTRVPIGYIRIADHMKEGTPVLIRTIDGDIDFIVDGSIYIIIGIYGEIYVMEEERFFEMYQPVEATINFSAQYMPVVKNLFDESIVSLEQHAKACTAKKESIIYAKQIEKVTKVFTTWEQDNYMYGDIGDYLAVNKEDLNDIFVIDKEIFHLSYVEIT
ncbi:DHH family phosphoesterase [Anaerosporobacter faecicola]|uniref:DHH family phosphoesterase n=1 Tax=Anaerosporobacter faecicola TaxID=2718714 RepID=UPI0014396045|nr:DHH family phosphoesterase [Anaerosporobacter faecicola]